MIGHEARALRIETRPPPRRNRPPPREPFAELSRRVSRFEERLNSPHDSVRLGLLEELTHFRPRDRKHYPRLFRYLLEDPSSELRWEGARRLALQLAVVHPDAVPDSMRVPLLGLVRLRDPDALARLRRGTAKHSGAKQAWGLEALGLAHDTEAVPIVVDHLDERAPPARLRAALTALRIEHVGPALMVLRELARLGPGEAPPMVPLVAAETLVRRGERRHLASLVEVAHRFDWSGSAYGPLQILEDLTGEWHPTIDAWAARVERGPPL